MKLSAVPPCYYRVKRGQTLCEIARAFGLPQRLIAFSNSLAGEAEEGQVLFLPAAGNLYAVKGGESKSLLCGSPSRFAELNGTACFYPGQWVILG